MRAIGYYLPLPIEDDAALQDIELPLPIPGERDLLVRVSAVSVNPIDTKVRRGSAPAGGAPKVLGWDAVGIVEDVGAGVTSFVQGDRVYYAGSLDRAGTNSELHVVDERIVARAPVTLDDAEAAALPLTTITAYELLFERLGVPKGGGAGQTLLIVGAAGGVGSILIQLARTLTQLHVVATASRAETRAWCLDLGAHTVIDHARQLYGELQAARIGQVELVASLTHTPQHYAQIVESLRPQGHLAVIDDMTGLDVTQLKQKSLSLHWELMFTKSLFKTPDMDEQGKLLAEVAELVDAGRIRTTKNVHLGAIQASNLRRAHALIERGTSCGKVVLSGF